MNIIYMRYGTSGFRDHHKRILEIAEQIGIAMARLCAREYKSYGIMITASHNHCDDNGVKIMDEHGDMVSTEIEQYLERSVKEDIHIFAEENDWCIGKLRTDDVKIHIGYDSRSSSPEICALIVRGIKHVHPQFPYQILPHVSTPQLHYVFSENNSDTSYLEYVYNASKMVNTDCILDCANGIGARIMESVANPCLYLANMGWKIPTKLNSKCSSDYVCTNKTLPDMEGVNVQDRLCASLDGDADRIVFYSCNKDQIRILNGDYIAALVFTYLSKQLSNCVQDVTIGYIYTGYTNKACVEYVKSLPFPENVKVSHVCTATGVKHLHGEAIRYDVGVYFEQNGHGNVVFKKTIEEIEPLVKMYHPVIGDGVMDLFATLYILQVLNWNVQEWLNIYTEYPSKLGKCVVLDKDKFKSCENELELIQPLYLQEYIHKLCSSHTPACRAFVRASGTENVVRLYVESIDDYIVGQIYSKLEAFINTRLNVAQYKIKGATFIVRTLTCGDVGRPYYELLGQLTKIDPERMDPGRTRIFIEGLGPNHQIFVVEHCESGRVVGSGTLLVEEKLIRNYGKVGHIEDIVIHTDYRGYGLGKILIDHLTSMGKNQACYKCILDCDEKNVGFYENCGYVHKGAEMARYM